MAIEARRRRKPPTHHKGHHKKRHKKPPDKKPKPKGKDKKPAPAPAPAPGAATGQEVAAADQSSVVATPGNTGTGQGMTPATLQGNTLDQQTPAGYFSTGPGPTEHYHPMATFVDMIATYTDESTADAGSTGNLSAAETPT